ncbi:MAG: hypothetical protein Q9163_004472 [Psora crenata]
MPKLETGQLTSRNERFCPYAAVNKYPYKNLSGEVMRLVSDNYFAHGAFKEREWSLYYIRTKLDSSQKPLLLIPEVEVEEFFKEIRAGVDIQVTFPDVTKDAGFQLGFEEEGSPRPRFLGRLTKDAEVAELEATIPVEGSAIEEMEQLDDRTFPRFRQKMEAAILSGKSKSKRSIDRKKKDRIQVKTRWCAELKRAQCYLGLRPHVTLRTEDFLNSPNMSWEASQHAQEEYERAAGISLPPLDMAASVPYTFDRSVVFVCVDIEAYERDQTQITEIGVCTLDTLDIARMPPGEGGQEWMKHIRCRHFRVVETAHLANTKFITGCADRFRQHFGTSEWISIKEAPQVIAACFKPPFSSPGQYNPHPASMHDVPRYGSNIKPFCSADLYEKRNIVLLGHDTRSDVDYMRKIGYDVSNLSHVIEAIDTVNLFRAYKHEQNPRSLGSVLDNLGLAGWHLHNAGNDAAYTTQALIGIVLAASEPRETLQTQMDGLTDEAKARMIEENNEWELADEEGGDGGEATRLLPAAQMLDRMDQERAITKGRKAEKRNQIRNARRHTGFKGAVRRSAKESHDRDKGGKRRNDGADNTAQPNPEAHSMPFDIDAMDQSMGFAGGGGWEAPNEQTRSNLLASKGSGSKSAFGGQEMKTPSPDTSAITLPQITDRMAERLALLCEID